MKYQGEVRELKLAAELLLMIENLSESLAQSQDSSSEVPWQGIQFSIKESRTRIQSVMGQLVDKSGLIDSEALSSSNALNDTSDRLTTSYSRGETRSETNQYPRSLDNGQRLNQTQSQKTQSQKTQSQNQNGALSRRIKRVKVRQKKAVGE